MWIEAERPVRDVRSPCSWEVGEEAGGQLQRSLRAARGFKRYRWGNEASSQDFSRF